MKPTRIVIFAVLATVGLSCLSCIADDNTVEIRGLTPPDATACTYAVATGSDVFMSVGVTDMWFSNGQGTSYIAGVQVYNYLRTSTPNTTAMIQSAQGELHLNSNDIIPRFAHVRIDRETSGRSNSRGIRSRRRPARAPPARA